jgi:hypothetical protein
MAWIWPRRLFRSPMTSPMYSSGRPDLDGHHRLEQRGIRLGGRLLERHRTRDLEGEL